MTLGMRALYRAHEFFEHQCVRAIARMPRVPNSLARKMPTGLTLIRFRICSWMEFRLRRTIRSFRKTKTMVQ